MLLYINVQKIGSLLFLPTTIPTTISQVAFNSQADAIQAIAANSQQTVTRLEQPTPAAVQQCGKCRNLM